jgi:lipooligosaccharide transport system permease protein
LEPLIFLAGVGLGMATYITSMDNMPYLLFLATGLPMTSAMFTAAFECSFGSFIRLEFDKVYDGMLAAPMSVADLFSGEILWAGTKGVFFSGAVVAVLSCFGLARFPGSLFTPVIGFFTGIMFASLSLLVTSFVKDINHFNFYFTGLLSPMFFFSGVVFPLANLPPVLRLAAEIFPLTHAVRLARALVMGQLTPVLVTDFLFMVVFTAAVGALALRRLSRRLIA